MTYTINGKEYTEHRINLECSKVMGIFVSLEGSINEGDMRLEVDTDEEYNPCDNPSDTDAIIDKCLDKLLSNSYESLSPHTTTKWGCLMERHNCTKLVAACICYIEINEAAL
jgi:hypothetical protein